MKKERDAQLDRVARLLDEARAYAKATGPNRQTRSGRSKSLVPVVDKRQPLITRAGTEQEIRDAVAFADRVGVHHRDRGGERRPRWSRRC